MAIRQHAQECAQLFSSLERPGLDSKSLLSELETQRSRFKVWAGNLGVFASERASADFRFQNDPTASGILVNLLTQLASKLRLRTETPQSEESPQTQEADREWSDSDSSGSPLIIEEETDSDLECDDSKSDDDLRQGPLSEISQIVSRLYHFSSIVRKPGQRNDRERVLRYVQNQNPPLDLTELKSHIEWQLSRQCPGVSPGCPFYDRMVEAAIYRRQKVLYSQSHQEKLRMGTGEMFESPQQRAVAGIANEPADSGVKADDIVAKLQDEERNEPALTSIGTEATVPNKVSLSTYARFAILSGITSSAVGRRAKLDIPPPPRPMDGAGIETQCPYCMQMIEDEPTCNNATREQRWRRHIMRDINPYVCLFEDCDSGDPCFKTIDEWIDHMKWRHTTRYSCQVAGHEDIFFGTARELEQHLAGDHGQGLPNDEFGELVRKGIRPSPDVFAFVASCLNPGRDKNSHDVLLCPMCDFSLAEIDDETDVEVADLAVMQFSNEVHKDILEHIATHMERIALLSLPERDDVEGKSSAKQGTYHEGTDHDGLDEISVVSGAPLEIEEPLDNLPPMAESWADLLGDFRFGGNEDYHLDSDPILCRIWELRSTKNPEEAPLTEGSGVIASLAPLQTTDPLDSFEISLQSDDGRGGFHTKNPPGHLFQQPMNLEGRGSVSVNCSMADTAHGKWSPDSRDYASLIVLEFRFEPGKPGRRITSATITVTFRGESEDDNHPAVAGVSFSGRYSLAPSIRTETSTTDLSGSFGIQPPSSLQATLDLNYEKVVSQELFHATHLSGRSCMTGVEWGPENAAEWKLRENKTHKTGIPVYIRVGILLRRQTMANFQCTMGIDIGVDAMSRIERLFGTKPKNDPVLFNPGLPATHNLMRYDLGNLGALDLALVQDVVFTPQENYESEGQAGIDGTTLNGANPASQQWLDCVDSFSKALRSCPELVVQETLGQGVKVALIDDGVDFSQKAFQGKFVNGKSFGYDAEEQVKPWYVSDSGHGTAIARIVLHVCPMAKIYALKLDTIRLPSTGARGIRPESAIQAIEAAIEMDVNIISMSWKVNVSDNNIKAEFDRVLRKAEQKRILMFCSAADQGEISENHYPTAYGLDKLFRIGAYSTPGQPYQWVHEREVDYFFPAVEIVEAKYRGVGNVTRILMESSGSAALATGLAALVIWLTIVGARYCHDENQIDGIDEKDVVSLQDIKVMKQAFMNLGTSPRWNHKFIEIWQVLEKPSRSLGYHCADEHAVRRIIHQLARNLVPKT